MARNKTLAPRRSSILLLPLIIIFLIFVNRAFAEEKIQNYDIQVVVQSDSALQIRETIVYDFGYAEKHGIFRDIPLKRKYATAAKKMAISDISVTDEFSVPYQFTTIFTGENLNIKIGNPDAIISGVKTYVIDYKVQNAVTYFKDHDEVYWNAVGNGWPVTTEHASVTVILPRAVDAVSIRRECFIGAYGGTGSCLSSEISNGHSPIGTVVFEQEMLLPNDGLTVVVGFPKWLVREPTWRESMISWFKEDFLYYFIPSAIFFVMLYLWYTRGRDAQGKGTIVPQYEAPEGLSPAEAGLILNEKFRNEDISAEIIELAVKGYISITRVEEKHFLKNSIDYRLKKLKDGSDLEKGFKKDLFDYLFRYCDPATQEVVISQFKDVFYSFLKTLREQISESVTTKGYFRANPLTIKQKYIGYGLSIVVLFFVIWQIGLYLPFTQAALAVSAIAVSLIVTVFGYFMPARTEKGALVKEYILGLRDYLKVAEEDRIKFHNAPEKNPERFEKLLPYAMVLGVEREWVKQFEGMYLEPPRWYSDTGGHAFSAVFLANSL
ncbi:MAG TPA: DUF2207 domain-containing protein, partial [Candidatus Paceibacterota bacterium]